MAEIAGRVVVVTGAAGGMGRAIVSMLADEGARLALADLDSEGLEEIAAQVRDVGVEAVTDVMDITEQAQVERFLDQVGETYGRADALINLPGISVPAKIEEMAMEDFDTIIDVNVKGMFLSAKHFIPLVDSDKGGNIVVFSSMAAGRANPNAPVYCAAKAAVSMLSKGLALQVKEKNVRVSRILPGPTDTSGFWGDRPVPREKFMRAEQVADVVRFVLSLPSNVVLHEVAFESFEFFSG